MRVPNQTLAVFVDINNLYHGGMKKYQQRLDYKKFMEEMKTLGRIQVAYAYGVSADDGPEGFKSLLRHSGYECRWNIANYNWNVGIAMDVMRQLDKVDLIVLGSGDPFLSPCAEYVKQQGIKCYSYGFLVSSQMRGSVDRFVEIPERLLIEMQEMPVQSEPEVQE